MDNLTKESNVQSLVKVEASKHGCFMLRNTVGAGYVSRTKIDNAPYINYGLGGNDAKGSSDLIGITTVTITPDMVGKKIGVFTAMEVKTFTGRATIEQLEFGKRVQARGGIFGVVRNDKDVRDLLLAAHCSGTTIA